VRQAAWLAGVLLLVVGCAAPNAPPKPTAPPVAPATSAPVAPPSPLASPVPTSATVASLAEDSSDVAASFLNSVLDVIDEAAAMAETSCDDLKLAQTDNPNVFRLVRGFATTLKNVAAQQPDLAEDEQIKASLAELDMTMGSLEGALRLCGITP
jgi:hypothetical protein